MAYTSPSYVPRCGFSSSIRAGYGPHRCSNGASFGSTTLTFLQRGIAWPSGMAQVIRRIPGTPDVAVGGFGGSTGTGNTGGGVVRMDTSASVVWRVLDGVSRTFAYTSVGNIIDTDDEGNVYCVYSQTSGSNARWVKHDAGGNLIWSQPDTLSGGFLGAPSMAIAADGSFGNISGVSAGSLPEKYSFSADGTGLDAAQGVASGVGSACVGGLAVFALATSRIEAFLPANLTTAAAVWSTLYSSFPVPMPGSISFSYHRLVRGAGNRLYLTAGDQNFPYVTCIDGLTGALLWQLDVRPLTSVIGDASDGRIYDLDVDKFGDIYLLVRAYPNRLDVLRLTADGELVYSMVDSFGVSNADNTTSDIRLGAKAVACGDDGHVFVGDFGPSAADRGGVTVFLQQ